MNVRIQGWLVLAALAASHSVAMGQAGGAVGGGSPVLPVDADAAAAAHWSVAEALQMRGDYEGALGEFEALAEAQRVGGLNAARTYWRIAEIRNALGSPLRTALALDAAAREFARFGDFDGQARALLEASFYYLAANQPGTARQRRDRTRSLVTSDFVSPAVRDEIAARLRAR